MPMLDAPSMANKDDDRINDPLSMFEYTTTC